MSNSSTLPNPDVYLNYLPPELAFAWELARDVYLVTCGALIWDILLSIPKDLKLFRRFNPGVIAYWLCRPAALGAALISAVLKTSPLPSCLAMRQGSTCSSVVATCTSTFLFLLRVQAVYSHSKLVRYAFFVLWLVQAGISILLPLGASSGPLYDTGYCIDIGMKKFVVAASLMIPFFDTLVFAFISYRLATTHANDSDHSHWQTFFSGKALPRLSKAMLQGGQQYYLLTVGMSISTVVLIESPSIPKIYEIILAVPGVALISVMACNVHRNLLFEGRQGREEEPGTIESTSSPQQVLTMRQVLSPYRREESTYNTGHIEAQNSIHEVSTDLDCAV